MKFSERKISLPKAFEDPTLYPSKRGGTMLLHCRLNPLEPLRKNLWVQLGE